MKVLVLAEICFDWSSGEYSNSYVEDIFLGTLDNENDIDQMREDAEEMLENYCEVEDYAQIGGSSVIIKVI